METSNITDKVVVITGASSGIGESTAKSLARQGARVVLGARRKDRIDAVVKEISAAGSKAIGLTSRSALKWKHSSRKLSTVSAASM
jgi:NADP-dependent 3-hydroxy acid dehydrogenase YdfG